MWGALDVQSDRFGMTRYRLTVYPPGITALQRRRLRLWRGFPVWGAAAWMVAEIVLTQFLSPWQALAMSTGIVLSAGAASCFQAGPERSLVRTRTVALLRGHHDDRAQAVAAEITTLAHALTVADSHLKRGEISMVDHEVMWWRVYERLTPSGRDARPTSKA